MKKFEVKHPDDKHGLGVIHEHLVDTFCLCDENLILNIAVGDTYTDLDGYVWERIE